MLTFARLVATAVFASLATGCAPAAEADDLTAPVWMVESIDGQAVPFDEIYLYFDGNAATLVTHFAVPPAGGGRLPRCRESVSEVVMDAGTDAMSFVEFVDLELSEPQEVPCDPELRALHDRIARALRENESWELTGTTLELIGTSRVRLSGDASD